MNTKHRFGLLLALLLAVTGTLLGQGITGDLLVNVTDPSSAVVPKATLSLVEVATGIKYHGESDEAGNYIFPQLKPGDYKLAVKAPGFTETIVDQVRVILGQKARVDARLQVGATTSSVVVSAAAETLLNAESAATGHTLDYKRIIEMPMAGRNFLDLALLGGGATPQGAGYSPASSWTGRGGMSLSIAGNRESNVSFLLNGIETRASRFGATSVRPSVDAIQEFRVQRSTFGAEFGRSAGVVNTTLRSGTNDLHVTMWEFHNNPRLNAYSFFDKSSGKLREKSAFTRNNFGVATGGPVVLPKVYDGHDRTFFFFNYEAWRHVSRGNSSAIFPSRAQLGGNLADNSAGTGIMPTGSADCGKTRWCYNVLDPLTKTDATNGLPFAGNVIPASRLDPMTQKIIPFTPEPNGAVYSSSGGLLYNTMKVVRSTNDWDQYNSRIDHQISDRHMVHGSFSWNDETKLNGSIRALGGEGYPINNKLVTMTDTFIFSPSILNEFRFGFNKNNALRVPESAYGEDYASGLFGLRNTAKNPAVFGLPLFNINGFGSLGSPSVALGSTDKNFQFVDNLSMTRGRHNIRTGVQYTRMVYYQTTNVSGNPTFGFDGRYSGNNSVGLPEFLLGMPISATGAIGDASQDMRSNYYGTYIQDDWRVHPELTLNFGIRYEYAADPTEIDNRSMYFDPSTAKMVIAGQGVRPSIVDPDRNNFAPRFGFAYRPGFLKNTVLRGGIGTYYSTDNSNEQQFKINGPPFYQTQTLRAEATSTKAQPTMFMKDMLPTFNLVGNLSPQTLDRTNRTPYLNQWSFGIQRSFANDWLAEVEYAGSTGQKLPQRRNLNIASLDPTGTIPVKQRQPFPAWETILLGYNGGWSSYNAMIAKIEKRFSAGFSVSASYTWQKALDLGHTDEASSMSQEQKKWDKGHSVFDVPHRFVTSYSLELPFGRGKALLSGIPSALDKVLGGWQMSGIATLSAGQFQTVVLGYDWLNIGGYGNARPNIVGDYTEGRDLSKQVWLTKSAFAQPATRVQGTEARTAIQLPGFANWDMGIYKNTSIGERFKTQFRVDMFNALNHTQFGGPELNMSSSNFGKIFGLRNGPRNLQLGLKLNF
ncbi:MAG TPA: TonB-dependent receptor [Bryobacteraceae bacterium]|nr:TonB-dependent receptor [Bryobacteraceae bacterium]